MGPNLLARITKVDVARREVWGRLVQEVPDKSGEIFDYDSSVPYFKSWSESFAEATNGASLGNLRSMHGKTAAGKFISMNFNDAEKAIDVGAKVVDDNEWEKCLQGVYTGFSIGGSYVEGSRKTEKVDGVDITRYTAKPHEGSLVDNPCIPTAKFFDIVKADGTVQKTEFRAPDLDVPGTSEQVIEFAHVMKSAGLTMGDAVTWAKEKAGVSKAERDADDAMLDTIDAMEKREFNAGERKAAAKAGEALPDGSFPIKTVGDLQNAVRAYGRAKDKAAAKAHILKRAKALGAMDKVPAAWTKGDKFASYGELRKGMWAVQDFASVLEQLCSIARSSQNDLDYEGDGSAVPMKLRNALDDLITVFQEMSAEESTELLSDLKQHAGLGDDDEIETAIANAIRAGALRKKLADPELDVLEFREIAVKYLGEKACDKIKRGDIEKMTTQILEKATNAEMVHIQSAHDHLCELGADCDPEHVPDTGKETHRTGGGDKNVKPGDLKKMADLEKQVADQAEQLKKLLDLPMPSVVTLRLMSGGQNVTRAQDQLLAGSEIDVNTISLTPEDPVVKNADGSIDYHSSRLLKAHNLQQKANAR